MRKKSTWYVVDNYVIFDISAVLYLNGFNNGGSWILVQGFIWSQRTDRKIVVANQI